MIGTKPMEMRPMNKLMQMSIELVERGQVPDRLIRLGVRRILAGQLRRYLHNGDVTAQQEDLRALIAELSSSPIAIHTDDANAQHYEVPTAFFLEVLGKRLKYSSCYWPAGVRTLDEAEDAMLRLTCERAQLTDGMDILELGCGWGSLSLWMAEHYPNSRILAVSNSRTQREFILSQAEERGFTNLEVQTADMNDFTTDRRFDRVVSVEMFEHMRNYGRLMERIAGWLKPDGKLFVHIFAHSQIAYALSAGDNWMAKYFFAGGTMPSDDLLLYFQRDLVIADHWRINGMHYARTLETWLATFDSKLDKIKRILVEAYGQKDLERWIVRWRLFFIACAELMAYNRGNDYAISHYLFERR